MTPAMTNRLNNLGDLLGAQGENAQALDYYAQALALMQQLYPEAHYPDGHADLARSLNNLGSMSQGQGQAANAVDYYEQALAL